MNRSARVLAVYKELRQALGDLVPAGEILSDAAALVDLFAEDEAPRFDLNEGRLPFDSTPVDLAMLDGGWRLLSRSWAWLGLDEEWDWSGLEECAPWRGN